MIYLFLFISIILDYLFPYFIPSFFNKLSLFYPMFTLTYLVFIYNKINYKKYLKLIIIGGLLYDILFSYLFIFNTIIFYIFSKIMKKINKYIEFNNIIKILILLLFIFLYDLILFLLIYISKYNIVNINNLIYKYSHSIIINILFFIWLIIIFKNKSLKNK